MTDYISREALLALLKDDREVCADSKAELKYIRADIRAIPAADVRPVKWIPVTERLPDESEPVLAYVYWPDYTDNEICYGQYIKNGRFRLTHYVEGELIKGYEVKAWMPLPEPPKEEKT